MSNTPGFEGSGTFALKSARLQGKGVSSPALNKLGCFCCIETYSPQEAYMKQMPQEPHPSFGSRLLSIAMQQLYA